MLKNRQLLISPFPPLPITSGGRMRLYQTIKSLAKRAESLTVFSLFQNTQELAESKKFFDRLKLTAQFFQDQGKRRLSYLFTGQPYWFSDSFNRELIDKLLGVAKDYLQIQIEFSQLLYLVKYLPASSQKVFVAHDVASLSFWRRLRNEHNLLKIALHLWRFLEIFVYERRYLPKFDLVIAMSDFDRQALIKHFHLKKVIVIPNGIENVDFLAEKKDQSVLNLGFIGSINHPPNLAAINFIIKKILPELRRQQVDYRFYLAGDNSALNDFNEPNLINLGPVDDVKSFYQKIDFLLAPIFAGSGTRIKILESLSFGRPVISSRVAAEGLGIDSPLLSVIDKRSDRNPVVWLNRIQDMKAKRIQNSDYSALAQTLSQMTWQKLLAQIPLLP